MKMPPGPPTALLFALINVALSAQQPVDSRPAVPVEPVAAIVEAFRSHNVVAVTAGHGDERGYAFLLSLVRDQRFVRAVNDIVIEEGSARYQDVADRFVAGGEVSDEALSEIWQNTTQPGPGLDQPWFEFFRTVRRLNGTLPPERRLRVLLGDPPIDWDSVHTKEDHTKWIEMRETFPADLVQREVLAKGRHALLTYGQGHFQRKEIAANYESEGQAETIVSRLEKLTGTKVFTIWTSTNIAKLQPDAASWPVPSVAVVRGTVLGSADFTTYLSAGFIGTTVRFPIRDGKVDFSAPVPRDQWRTLRAEDQFHAVLYFGLQPSATVPVSPARCADTPFMEVRFRRIAIAGMPPPVVDRLKQYCATVRQSQPGWVDPSPHRQRLVEVESDVNIEVLDWGGAGPNLVLLAQLGQTAHIYDDWAPKLAARYRVLGITRRGFGESSAPESGYSMERLGADIVKALDAEAVQNLILVGNGFAGEEMSWIAARLPRRIAGIIYLDAAYDRSNINVEGGITRRIPVRPPSAQDLQTVQSLTKWMSAGIGFPIPESEVRQVLRLGEDGRPTGEKSPPAVRQQILSGIVKTDYPGIQVPALAIYAKPLSAESFPGCRGGDMAVRQACTELYTWSFRHLTESELAVKTMGSRVRVIEIRGAHPFIFLSHEREVTRLMAEFVSTLPF